MKKQILLSIVAASLIGTSATVLADNDGRDRNGGWKIEKEEVRKGKQVGEKRHRQKGSKKRDNVVIIRERDKRRHKDKDRHKRDNVVVIKKPRYDRGRHDHWDRDRIIIETPVYVPDYGRRQGYARVISVTPVRVYGGRRGDFYNPRSEQWDEFNAELPLFGGIISYSHSDRYADRDWHRAYRVTYRYKGRLHTVRMRHNPGKFVRVNRHGELLRGLN